MITQESSFSTQRMKAQRQPVLEYATGLAGDLIGVSGKKLRLGIVDRRSFAIQSAEKIVRAVE